MRPAATARAVGRDAGPPDPPGRADASTDVSTGTGAVTDPWRLAAVPRTRRADASEGDAQAQEALGHPALEGLEPGDGRLQLSLDGRQPLLNAVLDLGAFVSAGRGPARVRAARPVAPLAGAGSRPVHLCGARTRAFARRGAAASVRCCASSTRRCVHPCLTPGRARRMRCRVRIDDAARKPPALSRDKAVLPSPLPHVRRTRCRHGILLTREKGAAGAPDRVAGQGRIRTCHELVDAPSAGVPCELAMVLGQANELEVAS